MKYTFHISILLQKWPVVSLHLWIHMDLPVWIISPIYDWSSWSKSLWIKGWRLAMLIKCCSGLQTAITKWIPWNLWFRDILLHTKTNFLVLTGNGFYQIWLGREYQRDAKQCCNVTNLDCPYSTPFSLLLLIVLPQTGPQRKYEFLFFLLSWPPWQIKSNQIKLDR